MKELSIEQKAQRYDEALKVAKGLYAKDAPDSLHLERMFPVLKESEDERIRKSLIKHFREYKSCTFDGLTSTKVLAWLERQDKGTNWKPSKEEMDVLYGLAYITNQYDEHKEEVITRLYQDLKREFFNGSSYENMFPNTEDGVRRRSTIQVLEYARSLDTYNQYGKADIDKNIAWLEKQSCQKSVDKEYTFKSISRLLDMIEPTDRAKSYCKKLIDTLLQEGYVTDAKIVSDCLKQMNGEKVAMAIMDIEKQGEQKHRFVIGDIISNGKVEFRVDNIVKNAIGQDCYFLVNIESEKNGTRYYKLHDSEGKTRNSGETTWLCEQVDAKFEKQGEMSKNCPTSVQDKSPININKMVAKYSQTKDGDFGLPINCQIRAYRQGLEDGINSWKPAWSEEDEEHINYLIEVFDGQQYHQAHSDEELVNWLKSLKQRYFWKPNGKNEKLTDVNHEYFSELLESDDSKDINDYAYQVAYCISHDWLKETATWDDVEKACKLGAEWNKRHHKSAWSDEDKKMIGRIRSIVEKYAFSQSAVDVNGDLWEKEYIDADNWLKSLKESVKSQNMWKVVDKGIYVKEPALAQKKDKSEPGHGFVVCYDHTLTPDVYERYIMLSDINCHSWWKPSDEQITVLELASKYERVFTPKQIDILIGLKEQLKKLKKEEV